MKKQLLSLRNLARALCLAQFLLLANGTATGAFEQAAPEIRGYAKDLFRLQLKQPEAAINSGFAYSIELHRLKQAPIVCANSTHFFSGDGIKLKVRSNFPAYAYVLLAQGSTGKRVVLYPPAAAPQNNFLAAGKEYELPEKGLIRFDQNPGTERLLFVLSRKAIDLNSVLSSSSASSINRALNSASAAESGITISTEPDAGPLSGATYVVKQDPTQVLYAELTLTHLASTARPASTLVQPPSTSAAPGPSLPGSPATASTTNNTATSHTTTGSPSSTGSTTSTTTTVTVQPPAPVASTAVATSSVPATNPSPSPVSTTAPAATPAPTGSQINRPLTDKWALIVGLAKYRDSSLNLKAPRKDAESMASFLTDEAGFAESHVIRIYDSEATKDKIISALEELGQKVRPDDLVVFYANCHGSTSAADGGNYLLCWDYSGSIRKQLLMQELSQTLKTKLHSERIVVIVQACHSGFVKDAQIPSPEAVSNDLIGVGRIVATACMGSESSWVYPRGGIFTRALIPNLRKYPKLKEALSHTREDVIEATESEKESQQMHPVIKYDLWLGDDAVLMAKPTDPQP